MKILKNWKRKIDDDFLHFLSDIFVRKKLTVDCLKNILLKDVREMGHPVYIVILL